MCLGMCVITLLAVRPSLVEALHSQLISKQMALSRRPTSLNLKLHEGINVVE